MKATVTYVAILVGAAILALPSNVQADPLPVANYSFENTYYDPTTFSTGYSPYDWTRWAPDSHMCYSVDVPATEQGVPAPDGTRAMLVSGDAQGGAKDWARYQITANPLQANAVYTLTASYMRRMNTAANWGGYWLSILASDGTNTYILANNFGGAGSSGPDVPPRGVPFDVSVQVTIGGDLSSVPVISTVTGTVPDAVADLSSGQYKIDVLVGGNYPGDVLAGGSKYWGCAHTLVDNVRLDIIPEPGTLFLLGMGLLGLLCYAWRKRR